MLRVILYAPIHTSLYSRLVLYGLLHTENVDVVGITVRTPWNVKRIRSELRRDGKRLVKKFIQKFLLREKAFTDAQVDNLAMAAKRAGLPHGDLREMAKLHKTPYLSCKELSDKTCEQFVQQAAPDVIVFTGGGLIRQNILKLPTLGVLNCHTGVLPAYRGMDVVEWTALEGVVNKVGFGVTLHYMDKGVDTGPILLVKPLSPSSQDTFATIRMRLEVMMVETMLAGVQQIAAGSIKAIEQTRNEGKQYFVMHPRIKKIAEKQLEKQLSTY